MYVVWPTNLAVGASCARDLSTHQLWRDKALAYYYDGTESKPEQARLKDDIHARIHSAVNSLTDTLEQETGTSSRRFSPTTSPKTMSGRRLLSI